VAKKSTSTTQSVPADCLAFCAPGAVVSAIFFMERVVIAPKANPATPAEAGIEADELYDLLIQAETAPVDTLLFISPHVLFDPADPIDSFKEHVRVEQVVGEPSWHYPTKPTIKHDVTAVVTTNKPPHVEPGTPLLETHEGEMASGEARLLDQLMTIEGIGTMIGLGRTLFECKLSHPIDVGAKRWLRLRVRPVKLQPPGKLLHHTDSQSGFSEFDQVHDILGADVLLESLRDNLASMLATAKPYSIPLPGLDDGQVQDGLCDFFTYALKLGFEKTGTYTRILDHRIMLVANDATITPITTEGCVHLEAITVPKSVGVVTYTWTAGLKFYSARDPFEAANQIYDYIQRFAGTRERAKSKPDTTYAARVEHILGCELIDIYRDKGYFKTDDGGETFYLNPDKKLPDGSIERCPILVQVAAHAAQRIRPAKAHFRIYFNCNWQQQTDADIARSRAAQHEKRFFQALGIIAVILGLINLLLRLTTK